MKLILFTGQAGAGKDTAARYAKELLEKDGKRVLVTHYADLVKYICRQFFGWNGEKDEAGRTLLQTVGTDVVRKKYPDYWVNFILTMLELFPDEWDVVLIPDARFENECELPREHGFDTTVVRIERPFLKSALTEEQKRHPSETSLQKYIPDYTIVNYESEDGGEAGLRGALKIMFKECL